MKTILETDENFICDINAPCFQVLEPNEIELVRASKTQVHFRKGDNLTKQGAFASYVLFIADGLARQYLEGENNKVYNLKIIQKGEFVGLSSAFVKNTFDYSTVALTDCMAFLVEKQAIAKVVSQNGLFASSFIQRFCEQASGMYATIRNVLYKQMNGRLAEALLYLNGFKAQNPEIFQLLSRKDLADFAGISTESAVKLLKSYEKDGLIDLRDKDIILLKSDTLEELSLRG
ncbi:Crp/Fnr family transcriptional regulator [uncultured Sunxiuqinia sp.]|uniref:Crp/Fnr family transcriptional regulator n=1 Tax=Sunxiuqinia rutila TaxID=1397841 RepID=UPI00260A2CDE|nr:Crp/Fnr family transcriptional regulator [uncultured Sunxiuqinia sp.]